MDLITIKDYADSRKITYEAVCKQVRQYKSKDLKGHLSYEGKLTFLDPAAVAFLDKHRMKRNIVLAPTSEEVKEEVQKLQGELFQAMKEMDRLKSQIIELQNDKMSYLEEKGKAAAYLEQHKAADERAQNEIIELKKELEEARQESNKYQRSWFGLYRKVQ